MNEHVSKVIAIPEEIINKQLFSHFGRRDFVVIRELIEEYELQVVGSGIRHIPFRELVPYICFYSDFERGKAEILENRANQFLLRNYGRKGMFFRSQRIKARVNETKTSLITPTFYQLEIYT
jgi:hypothetical protein